MTMTVGQFLQNATGALKAAEVESARLDCLVLLEDMLDKDRASLLAHPEIALLPAQVRRLNKSITQRQRHIPLAYIRGKVQFYGREFTVNKHVLVPRPETEALIEILLTTALPAHPKLADIGTGSGCIGITAALELPKAEVFLYDIDPHALRLAEQNARTHNAKIHALQQDLLTNCAERFDVILANLPYVPQAYPVSPAVAHEPAVALYSGADGLDHYRKLWQQISALAYKPATVLLEALPAQHAQLKSMALTAGYRSSRPMQGFALAFALA